ncbi:MCE family protein [Amycolatopsis sp. K13G38]|uniref:MCE family protein n=1 Tax=Amycolatopsis acididurans TaxID=2724524 RepID=A0ABX1J345_9PSEU|nr:MlaD family protein [Amycolatopsis acididurans]NKQ52711.1 MCE family protein [Amycolatopsis acididurans]
MRGLSRSTIVQLVLFAVVAVACTAYVGLRVFAANPIGGSYHVTVRMPETGGITPTSAVTYRGVSVGTVSATRIVPEGVAVELSLRQGVRIPASSRAVVSMQTPMALFNLDLRPADDRGPYLHDGSVIASENTSRPLPLETLLQHFSDLASTIDTRDVATVANEVATALSGSTGDLQAILNSAGPLLDALERNQPTLLNLVAGTKVFSTMDIPRVTSDLRQLTDTLRGQTPAVTSVLEQAPPLAGTVLPMLRQAQPAVATMLANLVSTSQVLVSRDAALNELLVTVPDTLQGLAGIEKDGVANFYLVASQGPACYYATQRRPATDTGPRQAQTSWNCPGNVPDLEQRGAANAPRPAGTAAVGGDEGTTGDPSVLGPRSWYSLLLQGTQGKGTP